MQYTPTARQRALTPTEPVDIKQATLFFDLIGTSAAHRNGSWVHAECPLASWEHEGGSDNSPSFGLKLGVGESRVHCFSCDYSATTGELLTNLHRLRATVDWGAAWALVAEATKGIPLDLNAGSYEDDVLADPPPPHVFPEELIDAFEPAAAVVEGREELHPYLRSRHVPYETAFYLGILWDPYRHRILFPVRDFDDRLRGLHGRHDPAYPFAADDPQVPYKMYPYDGETNPHVWLGETWVDFNEPVLIAESVFDLARVMGIYYNTITPLTASLSERKLSRLSGARRIVTLFDADRAGDKARKRLRSALPNARVHDVILPHGRDAADHHVGELAEYLQGHLELNYGYDD